MKLESLYGSDRGLYRCRLPSAAGKYEGPEQPYGTKGVHGWGSCDLSARYVLQRHNFPRTSVPIQTVPVLTHIFRNLSLQPSFIIWGQLFVQARRWVPPVSSRVPLQPSPQSCLGALVKGKDLVGAGRGDCGGVSPN